MDKLFKLLEKYENVYNTDNLSLVVYPDRSGCIRDCHKYIIEFNKFDIDGLCRKLTKLIGNRKPVEIIVERYYIKGNC